MLRTIATILILFLLLFNQFGHRLLFDYQQKISDQKLEASIDDHEYNDQELITIKIPLNDGYQTQFTSFERVNGEISYEGVIYKYVKRKIENGDIILMCIPNYNKMEMLSGRDAFFKLAYDFEKFTPSKHTEHKSIPEYQQLKYLQNSDNEIVRSYHLIGKFKNNIETTLLDPLVSYLDKPPCIL